MVVTSATTVSSVTDCLSLLLLLTLLVSAPSLEYGAIRMFNREVIIFLKVSDGGVTGGVGDLSLIGAIIST